MYSLDLRNIAPKKIYALDERFAGTAPDGREIGFTNYYMTLNGKPYFGISGELHFARVAPDQWEDAILKMKAAGINIVSSYVFWIVHEEEEGKFRFDGCRDVRRFLTVCEKHGMFVIARIGPFDHGEMRNGGLPDWLYGKPYELRENDPGFLAAVRKFFARLHEEFDGHYFSQGGCIIGTQIDNEYQHSAAPWEVTTGVSSEWVNGGRSGEAYMMALKSLMQEVGIVTPFYTCTAWGGAIVPEGEALPLWGGYSYQPWIFYDKTGEHPATPEYIYRDNHNNAVPETYNFAPCYQPESYPYACCEMMGGMMCSYNYRFRMDMRAVDALANTKLGSGCNLLGYYMFKGGTTPTGLRTPYLNEGQISKRSYDYQAAIGEFGQIRESYGRLRALHLFCEAFGETLMRTKTVLPEHLADLAPEDLTPLRFAVRVNGNSGFLFVNNFQDHSPMQDRMGETVELKLPGGDVRFDFDLVAGENCVLPFHVDLGGEHLVCATAQPLGCVGDLWFFVAPEGMKPVFTFERDGEAVRYEPAMGEVLQVGTIRLVTLSRKESMEFSLQEVGGRKIAILSPNPVTYDGECLRMESEDGQYRCLTYPEGVLCAPAGAKAVQEGVFAGWAWEKTVELPRVQARPVGAGRYALSVPQEILQGCKEVLLRVEYVGDIGHAFVGNELISDNFANGAPWDIRLDAYRDALAEEPLVLYITPKKEKVVVDVSSAMAGRMDRSTGLTAELLAAEFVRVEEEKIALQ